MYANISLSDVYDTGIIIHLGPTAERLFRKWQESGSDEDFEELADWIRPDIAEAIEFDIESISEQIVSL